MPIRSKKRPILPTVLGKQEIQNFFKHIEGTHALMAKILKNIKTVILNVCEKIPGGLSGSICRPLDH